MLKRILPLVILTTLLGCHEESSNYEEHGSGFHIKYEVENPATADEAERISIPFDAGYISNDFSSFIIDSDKGFDSFAQIYEDQREGTVRETTLQALQDADIDFDQFNLLIYNFSKSSISIKLTPLVPEISSNRETIKIKIDSFSPTQQATLPAFYRLAYKVKKSVKFIIIEDGRENIFVNEAGENLEPI